MFDICKSEQKTMAMFLTNLKLLLFVAQETFRHHQNDLAEFYEWPRLSQQFYGDALCPEDVAREGGSNLGTQVVLNLAEPHTEEEHPLACDCNILCFRSRDIDCHLD